MEQSYVLDNDMEHFAAVSANRRSHELTITATGQHKVVATAYALHNTLSSSSLSTDAASHFVEKVSRSSKSSHGDLPSLNDITTISDGGSIRTDIIAEDMALEHSQALGPASQAFPSANAGRLSSLHLTGLNLALRDVLDSAVTGNVSNAPVDSWLGDKDDPWNSLHLSRGTNEFGVIGTGNNNVALDMWLRDRDDPWTPLRLAHGDRLRQM